MDISEQPIGVEVTIHGAKNREESALKCVASKDFAGMGLEAGLVKIK